ncbi:MAG: hypothetical protein WD793_00890 [Steroidobacteraceae bacterium]
MKTLTRIVAVAAVALAAVACSQKEPAQDAIAAAEGALAAVYEDAQKYLPERYAEVKAELEAGRKALDEERYAEAIAAVQHVPAHAEALSKEVVAAKQQKLSELNAEWARLSGSLPGLLTNIGARLSELGAMRRLPAGMDQQVLDEANAAYASARSAWDEAGTAFSAGDLETAVARGRDTEGTTQDLVARLGMQAA